MFKDINLTPLMPDEDNNLGGFCKIMTSRATQEYSTSSSEVISQELFTSEQPKKNKMAFVGTFSHIKLLFGPLVIQVVA